MTIKRLWLDTLTWADVDPARHPFDAGTVLDVVRALAPPGGVPAPYRDERRPFDRAADDARWHWQAAMNTALVEHYGPWAVGWAAQMGGHTADGSLVLRWGGARDSITTPEETLENVAGALLDWRTFLEDLAELFTRHLPLPDEPRAAFAAWEATTAALVAMVGARSGADEHWHPICSLVLTWFLDVAEVPGDEHRALVDDAIGGQFWSFTSPQGPEVTDAAEALAAALTGVTPPRDDAWPGTWPLNWPSLRTTEMPRATQQPRAEPAAVPDSLAIWRRVRTATRWEHATAHVTSPARTGRDGIAEHLARRRYGAAGAVAALKLAGADAAEGGPLTFERLAAWQRVMFNEPTAPFRSTAAWSRAGQERYAYTDDLPAVFEACLAEATDPAVPLPSRAARVYLDVLFFHPFADGNGRSAALALYFVLARDGVILDRAAPLLMTRWPASDPRGAEGVARFVAALVTQTGRASG